MQKDDFISVQFSNDAKTYFASITQVRSDSFDCRFVHSGKRYTIDTHSFVVLKSEGSFPEGTPLATYQLFTPATGDLFPFCFVVAAFADNNVYLGVLNALQPHKNVTFLHSGSIYTFDADGVIVAKTMGAYPIGQKIKGMKLYTAAAKVTLAAPASQPRLLADRMKAIKTIVPTGEGQIAYVDGKVFGSVLISNFDINSFALKVKYHKGLEQLSTALKSSPDAKALIVGRASQTGAEQWNMPLSEQRAESVLSYLTDVNGVSRTTFIDTIAAGSEYPLKDNRGIEEQINRSVQIFFFIPMVIPPPAPPPLPVAVGYNEWEIQINPNLTVGAAISGTFLTGIIRNKATGEQKPGAYVGGGLGASLKYMPKVGGVSNDWVSFTTSDFYTIDDFDNTLCRYTTLGVGFLVGYSRSYISFPSLGANSIEVGGFELGSFGAGGSTTAGVWKFW